MSITSNMFDINLEFRELVRSWHIKQNSVTISFLHHFVCADASERNFIVSIYTTNTKRTREQGTHFQKRYESSFVYRRFSSYFFPKRVMTV